MKTFLVLSVLLASLPHAFAAKPVETPVAKLRAQFESGSLPSAQELRGIMLGRCFPNSDLESAILGALLIGNDPASLGGPLFETSESVNFRVAFGSPSEFDVFKPEQQPLPGHGTEYGKLPASAENNAWRLQLGSFGDWTSVWRVRKSADGAYLIALQYSARSERERAVAVSLLKACYFFKKLQ